MLGGAARRGHSPAFLRPIGARSSFGTLELAAQEDRILPPLGLMCRPCIIMLHRLAVWMVLETALIGQLSVRPMLYPCPCCGHLMFDQPPGSFDICDICFWEDDVVQLAFPDLAGGANHCSLIEGQRSYAEFGACEQRVLPHVRRANESDPRDPSWRPLDAGRDRYLHWDSLPDRDLWQSVKDSGDKCLYYWRSDYWLNPQKT